MCRGNNTQPSEQKGNTRKTLKRPTHTYIYALCCVFVFLYASLVLVLSSTLRSLSPSWLHVWCGSLPKAVRVVCSCTLLDWLVHWVSINTCIGFSSSRSSDLLRLVLLVVLMVPIGQQSMFIYFPPLLPLTPRLHQVLRSYS